MKLNPKITIILTISFFVISSAFIFASLVALRRNQSDNLSLFKNEFVQTNLEAFQDSSDLFFGYLDNEILEGKIVTRNDMDAFAAKIDPLGGNVVLMDLAGKNFLGNNNAQLTELLSAGTVDSFVSQWTLNPDNNDFAVDNLDKFNTGDTSIAPARVRIKIYEKAGLIVGYGKVFETGKVRVEFIQQQNESFYRLYLMILLSIFLLTATLIPLFSILFMKKTIVDPIKRLHAVTQKITEGDLAKRVEVGSSDEIGELSPLLQAKLLRTLETGEFERVGSSKSRRVDVRVFSATNADIGKDVAEGRFRQDLLFRLNTIELRLPPLRDRREDIPILAAQFLRQHAEHYRKPLTGFDESAIKALLAHAWPGNVRELDHAVERAVLMAQGEMVRAVDLGLRSGREGPPRLEEMSLEDVEALLIKKALARFSGNVSHAAGALGLSRSALYRRLQRYGLLGAGYERERQTRPTQP